MVGSSNNDECFTRSIGTFRATDTIVNFENMTPCVPTEPYEHYESFFYPSLVPTGQKNQPFVYLNYETLTNA